MAYLSEDDKQKQNDPNQPQGQQPAVPGVGASSGDSFASSSGNSNGVSQSPQPGSGAAGSATAGVGAGGVGAFTNIQSYLSANPNDNRSAAVLNKTVGDAFNQDQKSYQKQFGDTLSQAQNQVQQNQLGQDQASKMIEQMGNNYAYPSSPITTPTLPKPPVDSPYASITPPKTGSYGALIPNANNMAYANVSQAQGSSPSVKSAGASQNAPVTSLATSTPSAPASFTQSAPYQDILNNLKTHLTGAYTGPSDANYTLSDNSQRYGNTLGTDQGFNGLMNQIYRQASGGQMGSGALNLQRQLDTGNSNLNDARQSLLQKYSGLNTDLANSTDQTRQALNQAKTQYGQNEADLADYLKGQSRNYKGDIDEAVNDFNNQESPIAAGKAGFDQSSVPDSMRNWLDPSYFSSVGAMTYHPGTKADATNLGSVTNQRNRYNAILDALSNGVSQPDTIQQSQSAATHGKNMFDQDKFNQLFKLGSL